MGDARLLIIIVATIDYYYLFSHLVVSLYHCVEYSLVFRLYIYLYLCIYILLHTFSLSLDDSINLSKYDGPAFGCAILVVVVGVIAVVVVIVVVGAAVVILPELCCCLATNSGQNGGGGAGLEEAAAAGSGENDFLKICCCCSQRNTSSVGDNSLSASMNMKYPFQKKIESLFSRFIYISMVYTR